MAAAESSPNVQVLHERFEDDPMVSVLGVHFQDRGKICDHIEQCSLTFPVILNGGDIWRAYDVLRFPTFLVVGPDGTIIYNHPGRLTDEVRDEMEQVARAARATATGP